VCRTLDIRAHMVSVGCRQELTSKCIKILEAADDVGFLHTALRRCESQGWSPSIGHACIPDSRQVLHFVKILNEDPQSYVMRSEAARLLVDVFMASKAHARAVKLTLLGHNVALTVQRPYGDVLQEDSALAYLQGLLQKDGALRGFSSMSEGLEMVLQEHAPLKQHFILHALDVDGTALLRQPTAPAPTSAPVAVVFASRDFTKDISIVGNRAAKFARASVGHHSSQEVIIGMMFNEGLLGPAILSSAQDNPSFRKVQSSLACPAGRPCLASIQGKQAPKKSAWACQPRLTDNQESAKQEDHKIADEENLEKKKTSLPKACKCGKLYADNLAKFEQTSKEAAAARLDNFARLYGQQRR